MKAMLIALGLAGTLALGACGDGANSINDALDRRPNEKLRDAAEDAAAAVKNAAEGVKDAVRDATKK